MPRERTLHLRLHQFVGHPLQLYPGKPMTERVKGQDGALKPSWCDPSLNYDGLRPPPDSKLIRSVGKRLNLPACLFVPEV